MASVIQFEVVNEFVPFYLSTGERKKITCYISCNEVEIGFGLHPGRWWFYNSCCLLKIAWGPTAYKRIRHLSLCHLCTMVHIAAYHSISSSYSQSICTTEMPRTEWTNPNTDILTIKDILLCWTAGGQSNPCVLHVSLPSCSLSILRPQFRLTPPSPAHSLWGCSSRNFHALLQADRLNIINAHGSIQRLSLHSSLASSPACSEMTSVRPCQEQTVSEGLREQCNSPSRVMAVFGISHPRNQWILTASHLTSE